MPVTSDSAFCCNSNPERPIIQGRIGGNGGGYPKMGRRVHLPGIPSMIHGCAHTLCGVGLFTGFAACGGVSGTSRAS